MLQINGQRVYLRDHRVEDLDAFHSCMTAPETTHFLSWGWRTYAESLAHLNESIQENDLSDRKEFFLALVLNSTQQIIGEVGFTIIEKGFTGGIADMGYFLLRSFWGHGYASEAAQLMIHYCFTELKLHKVIANCDAENIASEKVMLHCGMMREGTRLQHTWRDGSWHDRLEYALLADQCVLDEANHL